MALYRTISMNFWTDSKIVDDFTAEDKYFYLYLFTNPHTNLCGCYEISMNQVANEIGYPMAMVKNLIERFESVHNVIRYSPCTKEILLLNWHKYNWTKSEKFKKPLQREIVKIKNQSFRGYLQSIFDGEETEYPIDTMCIDTTVTVTDTVSVTNTNTDSDTDTDNYAEAYKEIVGYLNEQCGTNYRHTGKKTQKLIRDRLKEGFTVDDFKTVIYKKTKQWINDPKMCEYLRPETLFSNKFEGYLNKREPLTPTERWDMA